DAGGQEAAQNEQKHGKPCGLEHVEGKCRHDGRLLFCFGCSVWLLYFTPEWSGQNDPLQGG
ncbi:MAG: hypothetical protein J6Q14_04120, partial [Oscillospiraceae bacterium]|nr:hypothetical protein [Oscillospiraceae bacterium]